LCLVGWSSGVRICGQHTSCLGCGDKATISRITIDDWPPKGKTDLISKRPPKGKTNLISLLSADHFFLQDVLCLCALPDGRRVVSGSEGGTLRVWDVETGSCERVLRGHGYVSEISLIFYFFHFRNSLRSSDLS
jgi:WD40 repeat protein